LYHAVTAAAHATLSATLYAVLNREEKMKSANELLVLYMRQAQLEEAMRQPGGARVTEELELLAVRQQLAQLPESVVHAVAQGRNELAGLRDEFGDIR
jgi:hypothetical protein